MHLREEKDFGMLPSNHSIYHIVARNIQPSSLLININAICEIGTNPLWRERNQTECSCMLMLLLAPSKLAYLFDFIFQYSLLCFQSGILNTVEEEHGILVKNGQIFSVPHFHFKFKSANISTILISKLKMCVCVCFGDLFLGYHLEYIFLEWNLV